MGAGRPEAGRDLGEDQHGAPAGLGDEGTTTESLCAPGSVRNLVCGAGLAITL